MALSSVVLLVVFSDSSLPLPPNSVVLAVVEREERKEGWSVLPMVVRVCCNRLFSLRSSAICDVRSATTALFGVVFAGDGLCCAIFVWVLLAGIRACGESRAGGTMSHMTGVSTG